MVELIFIFLLFGGGIGTVGVGYVLYDKNHEYIGNSLMVIGVLVVLYSLFWLARWLFLGGLLK